MKASYNMVRVSRVLSRVLILTILLFGLGFVDRISVYGRQASNLQYVPGRLLIKLKLSDLGDKAPEAQAVSGLMDELSQIMGVSIQAYRPLYQFQDAAVSSLQNPAPAYYVLDLPPSDDMELMARQVMENPQVEFAVPDYIAHVDLTPNDSLFPSQWAFNDSAAAKIGFPSAWGYSTGVTSIVIAVLDTGMDTTHPDLSGKNTGNGYNFVGNNSNVQDDNNYGHGTNVAGLAAASSNNNQGVAGACWNCRIMPVKVCDASGSCPSSAMTSGVYWAADHEADIINMSFGETTTGFGALLWQDAIDYAYNKGISLVAAAGNENEDLDVAYSMYPAQANHVIAVGATNDQDQRCQGSNCQWPQDGASGHGSKLDVMAPGMATLVSTDIVGLWGSSLGDYSSNFGGTSGATPIVSGLMGLMLSVNPSLSPDQIETLIKQNADPLGSARPNNWYGWGRINAVNSVRAAIAMYDNATFVEDVTIPNGTALNPGQTFTKTWRMTNSGINSWGSGYRLVFIGGNQMGAPAEVSVPLTSPGNNTDISVNMTAPGTGGNFTGYWRMRNGDGQFFGDTIWVNISVNGSFTIMPHCGNIANNETWPGGNIVHTVTCDVTVAQGVTLTISEGAIVKFSSEKSLIVNGKLAAEGTALNPVYFTSYKDDTIGGDTNGGGSSFGARSDWEHLLFNDSSDDTSTIDHAIIRFSGDAPPYGGPYGGVHLLNASPIIRNTEITENHYCALSANMGSFPTLTNNNIHDNAANGFCLLGGDIPVPYATWNITSTSYFLRGDVAIPFGSSLTVNPGVIVKLDSEKSLIVNGRVTVAGTSSQKVYFTSYKDDTVGGDTNGNGSSFGARSDWEHILFNNSSDDTSTIDHAIIRFSGDAPPYGGPYGGVHLLSASPTIQNTEFAENHYCAISADMGSFPTLTNNNIHNNAANGFCLLGGDIPVTPATWNITDTSYFLRGDATIPFGNRLTVNPGVIVKLDSEKSLIVNGKLTVSGTSTGKVYFTSFKDDTVGGDTNGNGSSFGARSDWEHILFNDVSDDTSLIDHAVIRFSGDAPPYGGPYGGIHLLDASPTIQNTEFAENHYCAISADMGSFPTLTSNSLHNNAANGFCLLGGDIPVTPATWNITNTSYFLRGDVTVVQNKSLTINPGVVVKLDGEKSLIVNGRLNVSGTSDHKVYFTSFKDDTVGGDTNGNGSSFGAQSDWEHILFNDISDDASLINHAVIRFSGDAPPYGGPYGGIHLLSASPIIQNSTITDNKFAGVSASSATPNFQECNEIYNNNSYGVYNATPTFVIIAENIWWGNASGPKHPSNPGGTGNAVSDGVDFDPFRTTPCDTTPPATFTLTVNKAGTGNGTVTSSPAGINCGSDCLEAFVENATVTLNATPAVGSTFTGWSADNCPGTGTCTITLTAATTVTASFNSQPFTQGANITIGSQFVGTFPVPSSPSTIVNRPNTVDGPVRVVSAKGGTLFASERVISGTSFNEIMGYPANQFATEYWFPWYDNLGMATWLLVGNPSTTSSAIVDIYIGGAKQGSYTIAKGKSITPRFNLQTGPVRVISTNGVPIFTSERSLYGPNNAFNEVMGYPASQFTTEYWFPWYDNSSMTTWILVGNPSTTSTAAVNIYIGGNKVGSYSIPKGGRITPRFNLTPSGPVRVVSTNGVKIFTSERVVYGDSFNEVMGYPTSQLTSEYFFPWYDNLGMSTWVLVGNPTGSTANVDIYVGGVKQGSYSIGAGKQINQRFPLNTGPVRVVSTNGVKVFTSERVLYGTSFNEVMGYPKNKLTTEYWFPWYDSTSMSTDIVVSIP